MFDFFEKVAEGIGFRLVSDFSNKLCDWIKEIKKNAENKHDEKQVATSGYGSQVATSGYGSQVATSGDYSQVATSGYGSQVATSGKCSKVATSGKCSKVATSGDYSKVATSGYGSKVATSGKCSKVATSGDYSKVATSGYGSQVATSGYGSQVATSGDYSKVATSEDYSKVAIEGYRSVAFSCGFRAQIKAKNGTWISLAEWEWDKEAEKWVPSFALSGQIGNKNYKDFKGRVLKETETYMLHNKQFYPIDISDGLTVLKLSEKKRDGITIIKGQDFDGDEMYIVKDKDLNAHGKTLEQALEDLQYKKIKSEEVQNIVDEIKKTKKVTKAQYRAITGACQYGTNKFCEEHNITEEEINLDDLRKILINDYGAEKFWKLIDEK